MDTINLRLADYYINRELSQLAFNVRVLDQAKDTAVPLLERLKFLCISSTNLDEFFEIRVSGLKHRLQASAAPLGPDNLGSAEVLRTITEQARMLVDEQYRVLNDEIIPGARGIKESASSAVTTGPARSATGSNATSARRSCRC